MAVVVHIAHVRFIGVDRVGNIVDKSDPATTIGNVMVTQHQHRVIEDASNASTSGQPSVDDYIRAEAAAGFKVAYMDQNKIITYPV